MLYLCHESSDKSGGLFEVGGGWAAELRRERAIGGIFMGKNSPASGKGVFFYQKILSDFTFSEGRAYWDTSGFIALSAMEPEVGYEIVNL